MTKLEEYACIGMLVERRSESHKKGICDDLSTTDGNRTHDPEIAEPCRNRYTTVASGY
jgi:hypothetical protein